MSDAHADLLVSNNAQKPKLENFSPIAVTERIDAMDILRGLALVGILLMNIEWFNRALSNLGFQDTNLTGLDHAVGWLIRCFVEGKFYKLFALLFGMGFAVMLIRAKIANRPFGAWFSRRMLVLITIGLLHMIFLWGGDILHDYGVAGLFLLGWITLLQKPSLKKYDNPKSFFKLSIVWLTVPITLTVLGGVGFGLLNDNNDLTTQWQEEIQISQRVDAIWLEKETLLQQQSEALAEVTATELLIAPTEPTQIKEPVSAQENIAETAIGNVDDELIPINGASEESNAELSPADLIEQQAQAIVDQQTEIQQEVDAEITAFTADSYWQATEFRLNFALFMLMFTLPFSFTVLLPIFILGYWLVSSGIMQNYQQHSSAFKIMAYIGLGLGTVLEVGGLLVLQHPVSSQIMLLQTVGEALFYIGQFVMAAGYFGLIMRLLCHIKWQKFLAIFTPLGRMALSNYLMHSVILTTIFYGYAGGYFGEISRAPQMLIVLAIVIFQLLFSRWWLNNYAFGPLEWLWRCLSYKKRQSMRIK